MFGTVQVPWRGFHGRSCRRKINLPLSLGGRGVCRVEGWGGGLGDGVQFGDDRAGQFPDFVGLFAPVFHRRHAVGMGVNLLPGVNGRLVQARGALPQPAKEGLRQLAQLRLFHRALFRRRLPQRNGIIPR